MEQLPAAMDDGQHIGAYSHEFCQIPFPSAVSVGQHLRLMGHRRSHIDLYMRYLANRI